MLLFRLKIGRIPFSSFFFKICKTCIRRMRTDFVDIILVFCRHDGGMGAQQIKESRNGSGSITTSFGTGVGSNGGSNPGTISGNCSAISGSVASGGTFGAGTSLRASRISKSKTPKDAKIVGLNIFTEHNGKCFRLSKNQFLNKNFFRSV